MKGRAIGIITEGKNEMPLIVAADDVKTKSVAGYNDLSTTYLNIEDSIVVQFPTTKLPPASCTCKRKG